MQYEIVPKPLFKQIRPRFLVRHHKCAKIRNETGKWVQFISTDPMTGEVGNSYGVGAYGTTRPYFGSSRYVQIQVCCAGQALILDWDCQKDYELILTQE